MEKKTIVSTLYLKDGAAVNGFRDFTSAGNLYSKVRLYNDSGIDKIIIYDLSEDDKEHEKNIQTIKKLAQNIEIPIDRNSEGFRLITRVQDEAHRFAIEFHRKLRSQGQVHSILDDIPGIGPARRKALMRTFASLDEIKNAEVEDLKKIPSMDEKSAKNVYNFFRGSEKEDTEATLMEEQ